MVRNTLKKINILGLTSLLFSGVLATLTSPAYATEVTVKCITSPCESSSTFQVNVTEILSVSLTAPQVSARGDIDTFLRNDYTLSVTSNNSAGFTASMTTKTADTDLVNTATASSSTIPTLQSSISRGSFDANRWGYSLNGKDSGDTTAGTNDGMYYPLVGSDASTPITLLSESSATTASQDIYFGAKANAAIDSGTYSNTVVISVVSGVIDNDDPVIPTNPAKPSDTDSENPAYDNTNDRTVYVATTNDDSNGTTTTTTTVNSGDTRATYSDPYGVTTTKTGEGTPLATGLAVTAGVAAASGIFFFILAKRRRDDDEEEDEDY